MNATRTCAVVGCARDVAARSMCLMHYKRARKAAQPTERFSLSEFDSYLKHDGPTPEHRPDLGPCWTWTGAVNSGGYGLLPAVRFGTKLAHRVALTIHLGRGVEGVVMHLCDNPRCSRPSHLAEGTQSDNMADAAAKGRARGGRYNQTHCSRGHELSGENVRQITRADGYTERRCVPCQREHAKKQAERRKAARHERGLLRRKAG